MKVGRNTIISPKASLYNTQNIEIGDNVRIDDFCILSGGSGLKIGSHVHIGVHASLFAGSGIVIGDFGSCGPFCCLHSESDNFDGTALFGPTIPEKFKPGYERGEIVFEKYVNLGARITVLPGVTLGEGSAVGANSLIMKDCKPWCIYAGSPARFIKERGKGLIEQSELFLKEYNDANFNI